MPFHDHIVEVHRSLEVDDRMLFEWTILDAKRLPVKVGKAGSEFYATRREAAAAGTRVLSQMKNRR